MEEEEEEEEETGETGEAEAELDDALEREFNRPLGYSPYPHEERFSPHPTHPTQSSSSSSSSSSSPSSSSATLLTFTFPGWGVEIYRDQKRQNPSVVRCGFIDQDLTRNQNQNQTKSNGRGAKLSLGCDDASGSVSYMYNMPDEVISNVFGRLEMKYLCSALQTCRWWQHIGIRDEMWERFQPDYGHSGCFNYSSSKNSSSISLPRWEIVKSNALSDRVQSMAACSHGHLAKGFSHLRHALRAWWETGTPEEPYCSKAIQGLIRKMTLHGWTVLYEFLTVSFAERADCLAAYLLGKVEEEVIKSGQPICPFKCNHHHQSNVDELQVISRRDDLMDFSHKFPSCLRTMTSEEYQSSIEASVGQRLWSIICMLWKRYKQWLMLVFEHCPGLNQEVMVEKARTPAWNISTPTLYEKGVICFRSQVLLKYGLRRVLQFGFNKLTSDEGEGSEREARLVRSVYHLLEEVDVRDDSFSPKQFTQAKLRRCFPIKRSLDN